MQAYARWLGNPSAASIVVGLSLFLFAITGWQAWRIDNDDDLLAFLPTGNPEVQTFYEINSLFGGMDVALIGIETSDPFAGDFLTRLQKLTRELKATRGLSHVLSLSNITDFTADDVNGGVVTSNLIDALPTTAQDSFILRSKVLSRPNVVGNLISKDARAVLIYCFLAHGSEPRAMSAQLRELVTQIFPDQTVNWGGNPFVSSYVYDAVGKDLRRLTPWAILVIVLLMYVSLRHLGGTLLALASATGGIAITLGGMQLFNFRLNLMLGSMPIVLFAIGSTYAIHVLLRYFDKCQRSDPQTALTQTLTGIGPVVLATGLTAAAAIASFMAMDIRPIQVFGLFTALGILVNTALALTFVPAAIRLFSPTPDKAYQQDAARRLAVRLAVFCQTRRRGMSLALLGAVGVFTFGIQRIQVGVDQSSFFSKGSPPDQAETFLRDHFGAAQFVQLLVKGDMTDPRVLLTVQKISDRLSLLDHVTGIQEIATVVATINNAMTGQNRIPDTALQVMNLYSFLAGDPSVAQLVTDARDAALLQIKVDTSQANELASVLDEIQTIISTEQSTAKELLSEPSAITPSPAHSELLWYRLVRLAREKNILLPENSKGQLTAFQGSLQNDQPEAAVIQTKIERFLKSTE